MARKGGNPDILKFAYQAAGDEPLIAHIQLRLTPSAAAALRALPDWQNQLRVAVDQLILQSEFGQKSTSN